MRRRYRSSGMLFGLVAAAVAAFSRQRPAVPVVAERRTFEAPCLFCGETERRCDLTPEQLHPLCVSPSRRGAKPGSMPAKAVGFTAIEKEVVGALRTMGMSKAAAESAVTCVRGQGSDFDSLFKAAVRSDRI